MLRPKLMKSIGFPESKMLVVLQDIGLLLSDVVWSFIILI